MKEVRVSNLKFLSPQELKDSRAFFELKLPDPFTWFLYAVLALLITGGLWAAFGEMEVVVKAQGLLRSSQNVSELKTGVSGLVQYKSFTNGQSVKKGDLLWSLDTRSLVADRDGTLGQISRQEKNLQDLQFLKLAFEKGPEVIPAFHVEAVRMAEIFQREENRLNLTAAQAKRLWDQDNQLPENARTPAKLKDLETTYRLAFEQWESYKLQQKQTNYERINSITKELEELKKHLATVELQITNAQVRATFDGLVEEYKRFNLGDFVASGEVLARIVPSAKQDLKVEISVASSDIPEVKKGMGFRLIFPKLPPSDYGQLAGVLETVPEDAWMVASGPPVYQLVGNLERTWMENGRKERVDLKAGMVSEARIIVKKKPIWRFILEKLDFIR